MFLSNRVLLFAPMPVLVCGSAERASDIVEKRLTVGVAPFRAPAGPSAIGVRGDAYAALAAATSR
jgi:hypothetical protein